MSNIFDVIDMGGKGKGSKDVRPTDVRTLNVVFVGGPLAGQEQRLRNPPDIKRVEGSWKPNDKAYMEVWFKRTGMGWEPRVHMYKLRELLVKETGAIYYAYEYHDNDHPRDLFQYLLQRYVQGSKVMSHKDEELEKLLSAGRNTNMPAVR